MKKYGLTVLLAAVMLAALLLGGCSKSDNFEPQQDCLYVRENGTVAEALFEVLDQDYYSADGLQAFIEDAVTRYNADAAGVARAYPEEDEQLPVTIGTLEVDEEGNVTLIMEYATTSHYIGFNGKDGLAQQLSTGSVESAIAVGIDLDLGLTDEDGDTVSVETIEDHGSYRVVLMQGTAELQVQGRVMYTSSNVTRISKNTVSVDAGDSVAYIIFR